MLKNAFSRAMNIATRHEKVIKIDLLEFQADVDTNHS
jgi:hypothetical protein